MIVLVEEIEMRDNYSWIAIDSPNGTTRKDDMYVDSD